MVFLRWCRDLAAPFPECQAPARLLRTCGEAFDVRGDHLAQECMDGRLAHPRLGLERFPDGLRQPDRPCRSRTDLVARARTTAAVLDVSDGFRRAARVRIAADARTLEIRLGDLRERRGARTVVHELPALSRHPFGERIAADAIRGDIDLG